MNIIKDSLDLIIHPSSTNKTIQNYFKNLQVGLTDYIHKFKMQNCGKMSEIVEGHNITVPRKSGGPESHHLLIS